MTEIFVDGSCKNNPGPGGFGVVIFKSWSNEIQYLYQEKCMNTTNNREELKAILHATKWMIQNNPENEDYIIYSDSSYCVNVINNWMLQWGRSNWKNSRGKIIANQDLIIPLYHYYTKKNLNCQIMKIKGHSEILGNELADALATFNTQKFNDISQKLHEKECL